MLQKLLLTFLSIILSLELSATGPSHITAEIRPISINDKGEILCHTRFLKNPSGGHYELDIEYGLCVLTNDTILQFTIDTVSFQQTSDSDEWRRNYNIYEKQIAYRDSIFYSDFTPRNSDIDYQYFEKEYGFKKANVGCYKRNDSISVDRFNEIKEIDLRKTPQKALYGAEGLCSERVCISYDFGNIVIIDNRVSEGCESEEFIIGARFNYPNLWANYDIGYDCQSITGVIFIKQAPASVIYDEDDNRSDSLTNIYSVMKDEIFIAYCKENGFDGGDGILTPEEAAAVTEIKIQGFWLYSLAGIEFFTGLTRLSCNNNRLTKLPDLSKCTKLEYLDCQYNRLSELPNLSACSKLYFLDCRSNRLTELPDLSKCTELIYLYCHDNLLTKLPDLSKCTKLEGLLCNNNQLTELPYLGACTKLERLSCDNNQLTALPDLSKCTTLYNLFCDGNRLTELPDITANRKLTVLHCHDNLLTKLPDLSKCVNLGDLYCHNNQLTQLPYLDRCTKLYSLHCNDNNLITLPNLSRCTELSRLNCSNNLLTEIDISKCINLMYLDCGNNQLTELPDISGFIYLEVLICSNNLLTALDISGCTMLYSLRCESNAFSEILVGSKFDKNEMEKCLTDYGVVFKKKTMAPVRF